jgi:8-oxo-dGTP diphosphatase
MSYKYDYPRPAVTTDAVIFCVQDTVIYVLLIQRKFDPFAGMWALPGGFLDMNEDLSEGVQRELKEETGLDGIVLKQLQTYGAVDRDPRHRTITVAYYGIINEMRSVEGLDDASDARWFPIHELPSLAFDHEKVITDAVKMAFSARN